MLKVLDGLSITSTVATKIDVTTYISKSTLYKCNFFLLFYRKCGRVISHSVLVVLKSEFILF